MDDGAYASWLRERLQAAGLTAADLRARMASRGEPAAARTVRAYLAGDRRPGYRRAVVIMDCLDVPRQGRIEVIELLAADEVA